MSDFTAVVERRTVRPDGATRNAENAPYVYACASRRLRLMRELNRSAEHRVHHVHRKEVRMVSRNADVPDAQLGLRRVGLRDEVHRAIVSAADLVGRHAFRRSAVPIAKSAARSALRRDRR